jgi:transposase
VPVTGARKSVKIFGCVDIMSAEFIYRRDETFNAETYLKFLDQMARKSYRRKIFYIQDNASYHKDADVWQWFKDNKKWIEVYNLPPYSPELNATERLWHHTRITGTHNRYFDSEDELIGTLLQVFKKIQKYPSLIRGYLSPFQ